MLLLSTVAGSRELDVRPEAITLEQAIELALRSRPARRVERAKLEEAKADSKLARSNLLARVWASASYSRLDSDRLAFGGATGAVRPKLFASEATASLRFRQPLFDGRSWPTHRAAGIGVEVARLGLASSDSQATFEVTLAYTRLVEAGKLVEVAREALSRQVAFKELAQAFYEAGKTSRLDVLRAESQRTDAERALLVAEENEALAQVQLRGSLGSGMDRRVLAVDNLSQRRRPPPSEQFALAQLLRMNSRLSGLLAQERQAEALRRAAWGEHLPSLSLQGSYGIRHRDIGGAEDEYAVGAFLDVPLFSGLSTTGRIEKMEAQQRQLAARRRALQDQLRVDLQHALTSWRVALANESAATRSVEVNQEAHQAALSLYGAGKITALEVLTSQSALSQAEASHVLALGDYTVARARYQLVIGNSREQEMVGNE